MQDEASATAADVVPPVQDEASTKLSTLFEMQGLQDGFHNEIAMAELAASDQQTVFDKQVARAELEEVHMRTVYEELRSDNEAPLRNRPRRQSSLLGMSSLAMHVRVASGNMSRNPSSTFFPCTSPSGLSGHSGLSEDHECITIFFSDL